MEIAEHEQWVTVEEVAAQFRVHPQTVRRLIKAKKLRAIKFGGEWRISKESLDSYVEELSKRPAA